MRSVKIPKTIEKLPTTCTLCGGQAGKDGRFPFVDFLMIALDNYESPTATLKGLKGALRLQKIAEKIEGAKKPIRLEEADWELVKNAVTEYAWKNAIRRKVVAYFEAIEEAEAVDEDKKPKKK